MTTATKPKDLTLAQILSDLGSLKACPPSLRAGVLSERGAGLSTIPIDSMNHEDDLEVTEEESGGTETTGGADAGRSGTIGQVNELLRMKTVVEMWIKKDGEGEKRLGEVREVEDRVRDVLVQMSRYMDV